MVRKEIREVVENLWTRLNLAGIEVKEIYLFGSYLKGDFHDRSDIDLMIVLPGEMQWDDDRKTEGLWIAHETDARIEAWFIGENDFELLETPMVSLVREQGQLIKAA